MAMEDLTYCSLIFFLLIFFFNIYIYFFLFFLNLVAGNSQIQLTLASEIVVVEEDVGLFLPLNQWAL
jgi:hypothetical protein